MKYARTWAAADGTSHLEEVEVELAPVGVGSGNPSVASSPLRPALGVGFVRIPIGWSVAWHPAPRRQFIVGVAGELEIRTTDGEARRISPGAIMLVEDTTGRGHLTSVAGTSDWWGMLVPLPE